MALIIRPQTEEDSKKLRALETQVFECEVLSLRSFQRFLKSPSVETSVATEDGKILGYATVLFRSHSKIGRVYSLAVHPEAQGKGIGGILLKNCETISRDRGCAIIRLEVKADNPIAIDFYKKRGYIQAATRQGYYQDGKDALLLRKPL